MEICLALNDPNSASSIRWAEIPRVEALSRSIRTFTCGLRICRSEETSCTIGSARSLSVRSPAARYSSSVSEPCRVYWYWLLVSWPPIRIGGGFWRKARMPGTAASFGRSASTTWSALRRRSERGLSRMKTTPELAPVIPPREPVLDMKASTFGSCFTIAARACWCFTMSSNEIPCAASVKPKIWPVSWLGMNPLGIIESSAMVATCTTPVRTMMVRRCRSDHLRPAS